MVSDPWREIPAAALKKFQKKIGKIMAPGAVCYAQDAEMLFKPLFCQRMFFLGEGEMDGEIVQENDLPAYFLEGKSEGEVLSRW